MSLFGRLVCRHILTILTRWEHTAKVPGLMNRIPCVLIRCQTKLPGKPDEAEKINAMQILSPLKVKKNALEGDEWMSHHKHAYHEFSQNVDNFPFLFREDIETDLASVDIDIVPDMSVENVIKAVKSLIVKKNLSMPVTTSDEKRIIICAFDAVPQMTISQMESMLNALCQVKVEKYSNGMLLKELQGTLTSGCLFRLERDSKSKDLDVQKYLRCAFLLQKYILALRMEATGMKLISNEFIAKLLQILLSREFIQNLTPGEFVYSIFLAGEQKYMPGCGEEIVGYNGLVIPEHIVQKFINVFERMKSSEVGIVCNGLYKCNLYMLSNSTIIVSKLSSLLIQESKKKENMDARVIASACKIMATMNSFDYFLSSNFVEAFAYRISELPIQVQLRLIYLICLGRPSTLNVILHNCVQSIKDSLDILRLKDVEKFLYTLYFENYRDDLSVYAKIKEKLIKSPRNDVRDGRSLIHICSTLAKFSYRPPDELVEEIFKQINSVEKLRKANTTNQTISSLVEAVYQLSKESPNVKRYKKKLNYEIKSSYRLYLSTIRHLVELDVCMELIQNPKYSGERLDPSLRKKWELAYFCFTQNVNMEDIRSELLEHLQDAFGPHVRKCFLFPSSKEVDMVMSLPNDLKTQELSNAKALPISEEDVERMKTELYSRTPDNKLWIAILLPKIQLFNGKHELSGSLRHKVWILRRLGYKVLCIKKNRYLHKKENGILKQKLRKSIETLVHRRNIVTWK